MMDGGDPKHPANQPPTWEGVLLPVPLRAYIAARAMQSLILAKCEVQSGQLKIIIPPREVARNACLLADALIAELNKP